MQDFISLNFYFLTEFLKERSELLLNVQFLSRTRRLIALKRLPVLPPRLGVPTAELPARVADGFGQCVHSLHILAEH